MRNVYVCSAAENDFTDSLTWYAKKDSDLARQFASEFDAAINRNTNHMMRFLQLTSGIAKCKLPQISVRDHIS